MTGLVSEVNITPLIKTHDFCQGENMNTDMIKKGKLYIELSSNLLDTPTPLEKTAYELPGYSIDEIADEVIGVATRNPLHKLSWEIRVGNKVCSGTYSSDNDTDSETTLREDIEEAIKQLKEKE